MAQAFCAAAALPQDCLGRWIGSRPLLRIHLVRDEKQSGFPPRGGQVAACLAAGGALREMGFLTITSGGQSAFALRPGRRHSIVNYALIRALPSFA